MTNLKTNLEPRRGSFRFAPVAWLALCCAGALSSFAQTPVSNLVFTVGTTIRDATAHNWSYVLIGAPQPQLLAGKRFDIYGKAGYPTNTGSFTLRGTIFQQTDPNAVNTLLNQSVSLGEDLMSLGTALDTLLHSIPGVTNLTLPQKVIEAFQVAQSDPDTAQLLGLLAHMNPGLTEAAGQAFAEVITGVTTYEVREVNPASGVAAEVVGRVTITPGSPLVLPAPGFPFQVTTNDPSDNLRIRLRWGTPAALRRVSLLSFGFNVWRIPLSEAISAGYSVTPPTIAQLYSDTNFTLANPAPVVISKDFSAFHGPGGADDPADKATYFFSDTHGRAFGFPPFNDGDEFYYFVTARDVLGRDGFPSPGGTAEACRRIPPQPPSSIRVLNSYRVLSSGGTPTNEQALMVTWQQNTNATDLVNHYWIYRWPNPAMALTNGATPTNYRVGVITQLPNTNLNSFLDNGSDAPLTPGVTNYWYTVRAVSDAACGPLLSPDSMPAWGVLRERFGPVATTGEILGSCGSMGLAFETFNSITNSGLPDTNHWNYRFTCQRRDPGTAWVEFFVTNQFGDSETLGPIYFPPTGDTLSVDYSPSISGTNDVATVTCVAGSTYGLVSQPVMAYLPSAFPGNVRLETVFLAGEIFITSLLSADPLLPNEIFNQRCLPAFGAKAYPDGTVRMQFDYNGPQTVMIQAETGGVTFLGWKDVGVARGDPNGYYTIYYPACLLGPLPNFRGCLIRLPNEGNCTQHVTRGDPNGPVNPIKVSFLLTPRTHEYRLYRTVNDGPRTMIAQSGAIYDSLDPYRNILVTDDTMPPSVSRLCYYVQLLDEHGNGSPLTLLGCKEVKPATLPRPVLAQPQALGSNNNPLVGLNWFCQTSGVYRFQILIQRADHPGGSAPLGFSGVQLKLLPSYNVLATYFGLLEHPSDLVQFDAALLLPPNEAGFGAGPQYTTTASVLTNVPYNISVAAMDDQGNVGEPSQVWKFTWKPTNALPTVPWPARPLPPVNVFDDSTPPIQEAFLPRVAAVVLLDGDFDLDPVYPVGIRIGQLPRQENRGPDNIGTTNFLSYEVFPPFAARALPPGPEIDPNTFIFRRVSSNPSRNGDSLLPIVVYRQQVANATFPHVSKSLTQVTPLLERLSYGVSPIPGASAFDVTIYDRLIGGGFEEEGDYSSSFLYLRDQQPVIIGASYQYFVVRLNDQREISEIIPAGTVTIPSP